jgi:hypothetical protein
MTIEDVNTPDLSFTTPDGQPLNVGARNPHTQVDIIHGGGGGGGGGGGSSIDYTALITAIKSSVAGIDADTNALAPILLAVDTLEAIGTTGNATSSQILTAVSSILTQAQATSANTDQLESLLQSLQSTLQTESDQTQIGLAEIKEAIEAMPLDVEFLQVVDYVEGGQVIGTSGVTVLTLNDLAPVSISGATPPWIPPQSCGATDSLTSWKLVGQLQTVAGQRYNLNSSISVSSPRTKYIFGGQTIDMVQAAYDDIEVLGDGSLIEVGYLFEPNAPGDLINQFSLTTLPSVSEKSCTDFLRKIVGGVTTDFAIDGVTPYLKQGAVLLACPFIAEIPAVFRHGFVENDLSTKVFEGYKSLSIYVLSGTVDVSDGTTTISYPLQSDNGAVAGVEYGAHSGFYVTNKIYVSATPGSTYTWNGVV